MSSRTTTGSILRDLDKAEAENLVIRSQLMRAVQTAIKERGLTQVRVAEILDTDQSGASNLMTGRVSLFSIDMLVNMVVRMGLRVDVQVGSPEPIVSPPHTFVNSPVGIESDSTLA
jgi:predicted XRE-type DNA-binding protein